MVREKQVTHLHRSIRRHARKDKTEWIKDQVLMSSQAVSAKETWAWIKRLKKDFAGKSITLRDKDNKIVNTL